MNDSNDIGDQAGTGGCQTCGCGAWWRLPVLLAVVLAAITLARLSGPRDSTRGPSESPPDRSSGATTELPPLDSAGQTVSLVIQFGDGQERQFSAVGWHKGMTVDDLLTAASRMPDGITYTVRGDGEQALLTRIVDAANEGAAARNWTYSVNDREADRSFAIYQLEPGDRVLWTYGQRQ